MKVNGGMHGEGLADVGSGGTVNIISFVSHFLSGHGDIGANDLERQGQQQPCNASAGGS